MDDINTLIRLKKKDIKPAAKVLARAFHNYPTAVYMFPEEKKRLKLQTYIFEGSVHYGIRYGEAYATSSKYEGIAIWLPPENVKQTILRMIRCGGFKILFKVGFKILKESLPILNYMLVRHKLYASFPHWYLEVIGVDPDHQRKGYGNILLNEMISRIDKESLPIYLETNLEVNLNFYQNHGFKVVDEGLILNTGVPNWCLLRKL